VAVASAGHMQVCTSLQTDHHASTSPLSFLQAGCPSCRPTNRVKALKAVSQYQKGKSSLDLNETRDDGFWKQWHQLDHVQTICTSLQTDNHSGTCRSIFYRLDAFPDAQPSVSRALKGEGTN